MYPDTNNNMDFMSSGSRNPIVAIILGIVKFGFQQKESVQKLSDPSATVKLVIPRNQESKKVTSILSFRQKKESHNTPLPPILLSFIHAMIITNTAQQVQNTLTVQRGDQMKKVAMLESQRKAAEQVALAR